MTKVERIFADSNILYSASLPTPNNFEGFWLLPGVEILTCQYSIGEVSRNLQNASQRARLWHFVYRSHLVPDVLTGELPPAISLPEKDRPIFLTAQAAKANTLLTGDIRHFGGYYGQTIADIFITPPFKMRKRFPAYFRTESIKR